MVVQVTPRHFPVDIPPSEDGDFLLPGAVDVEWLLVDVREKGVQLSKFRRV